MQHGVLAQAFVQPGERVVARERLVVRRQQVALLGVQQEDQPQDDGEQGAVDLVRVVGQRLAQQGAVPRVVRRLEAPEQLVQRVQAPARRTARSPRSGTRGCREQRGRPFGARLREQALLAEQQAQGAAERVDFSRCFVLYSPYE